MIIIEKKFLHTLIDGSSPPLLYGIDIKSWDSDLNPFLISDIDTVTGYTNISSIENWYNFVDDFRSKYHQIRILFSETTFIDLSESEKKIICYFNLTTQNNIDTYLSEDEKELYNYYKIYNFSSDDSLYKIGDLKVPPHSLNYKTDLILRLHPEYIIDDLGFLESVIYYEYLETTLDSNGFTQMNYTNPILTYDANYTIHPNGYVDKRTVTRSWYLMDGTLSNKSKVSNKVYNGMMARAEGNRRRRNLISKLLVQIVGLFIITSPDLNNVIEAESDAIPFVKEISKGISDYYEYGNRTDSQDNPCLLIQLVGSSTYDRLNNNVPDTSPQITIRDYIMFKLNV